MTNALSKLGQVKVGKRTDGDHLDADQGLLFADQLTLIEKNIMMRPYPDKKIRKIFPMDSQGGPGVVTRKYRMMDRIGVAKALADYARDIPRVTLTGQQFMANAKSYAIGYGWSQEELDEFLFAGQPLETMEAAAARDGYEDTFEDVAFSGDADHGIQGFNDHPNIPIYTGAGTWASATADAMIGDITAAISGQAQKTKDKERVNLVLLPGSRYDIANTTRLTVNAADTVLQFMMKAFPNVAFDRWYKLETASSTGGPAIMGITQDPEAAYVWEPQAFQTYAVQVQGFEYLVPCKGKLGGVVVKRPLAHFRIDNI